MRKKLKKFLPVSLAVMLAAPLMALGEILPEPINPVGGNPITLTDVTSIINTIANFLIVVGVIIAVIFIIIGGIKYMAAGGNAEAEKAARKSILNGLIGAAIVLGVGILLSTAQYLIQNISQGTLG